jgi:hypothetical protein
MARSRNLEPVPTQPPPELPEPSRPVAILEALDRLLEVAATATVTELAETIADLRPAPPLEVPLAELDVEIDRQTFAIVGALDGMLDAIETATVRDLATGLGGLRRWVRRELERRTVAAVWVDAPPERRAP